jgi:hypothetical protein
MPASLTVGTRDLVGHGALLASATMHSVPGINDAKVSEWLVEHVGATAPLTFELIAGGRSNLTFRVTDAQGNQYALRRPPTSHVLPTAHDMVREHTVISALYPLGSRSRNPSDSAPTLRSTSSLSTSWSSSRARSCAIAKRPKPPSTSPIRREIGDKSGPDPGPAARRRRGRSRPGRSGAPRRLHRAPTSALAQPVRTDARRGRRSRRSHRSRGRQSAASIPTQQRVTVVHGDYRLDNTVLDETAECAQSSIGRSAPWAIRWPTSDYCSTTGPSPPIAMAALLGSAPTTAPGLRHPSSGTRGVRVALVARRQQCRTIKFFRLLEVGLHYARCLRALQRRRRQQETRAASLSIRPISPCWPKRRSRPWRN